MNIWNPSIGVPLLAFLLTGCAGAAVPHAQSAETQAAVRAAEELGAEDVPDGALHLKFARDQIKTADQYIADGENEKAALILRGAQSDAELALALARADAAHKAASTTTDRIEKLRRRPLDVGGS